MSVIITPGRSAPIFIGVSKPDVIDVGTGSPDVVDIEVGISGPKGPKGDEGGTPIVPVPFNEWPPAHPEPNTLYLRLTP